MQGRPPSTNAVPPTPFRVHYKSALSLLESGQVERASRRFLQAAIADPEQWCNAAIEIGRAGNEKLALACLAELLRIAREATIQAATWNAIGNIYSNVGMRDDAMACFKTSWEIKAHPGSASNQALIHLWNGEISDASRWIERSLKMDPFLPESQFVRSMITLVGRGDYRTGFQQYECRWRSRESGLRKVPSNKPEWAVQNNGRLLVYAEQGMGDTILALRYARLIKEMGLRQTWVVQPQLKRLVESMGIIDSVKSSGEEFHDYDFHIPAISLPCAFGTSLETVPEAPYIEADPEIGPIRNIGICWRGSSVNRNNNIRSAGLEHWSKVLA